MSSDPSGSKVRVGIPPVETFAEGGAIKDFDLNRLITPTSICRIISMHFKIIRYEDMGIEGKT
jgi:hypothetical protein